MATAILGIYGNLGEFVSFNRKVFPVKPLSVYRKILSFFLFDESSHTHKNPTGETSSFRPWDELHRDVMELIIKRLDLRSTIRLKSVCSSWRSLLLQMKICKHPLLVLSPEDSEGSKYLSCFCITEGTVINLKLPELLQEYETGFGFIGSSKGWLFVYPEENCELIFMHNLDSKVFRLPLLSTIPQFQAPDIEVCKVELSSPDPCTCIVAAVLEIANVNGYVLALCKPEDKHWSIFSHDDLEDFEDILFINGELCIIKHAWERVDGKIVECCTFKIGFQEEVRVRIIVFLGLQRDLMSEMEVNQDFALYTNYIDYMYLAESANGELLLIRRFYDKGIILPQDGFEDWEQILEEFQQPRPVPDRRYFEFRKTGRFDIFKVDLDTGNCSELKNMGDQVIFVHRGGSLVLGAASDLGLQPNCIYFTKELDLGAVISFETREVGIYMLNNRRIHRFFPSVSSSVDFKMGWLTVQTHSNNLSNNS